MESRSSKQSEEELDDIRERVDSIKVEKKNLILCRRGVIETDYVIGQKIGSGTFGTVRSCIHKQSKEDRALKIIDKEKIEDEANLYLEIDILKHLVHPNILALNEFYEDNRNFYLITEVCEGGELFDKLGEARSLSEKEAVNIMEQLLSAVMYAHSKEIVHRDLKPENILLDFKGETRVKIIDWGCARFMQKRKRMTKMVGTSYYMAPEVISGRYDSKCDIWSLGVIAYMILTGRPPFSGDSDEEIFSRILDGNPCFDDTYWSAVSEEAKSFVQSLLTVNFKKRPTAKEALEHPWVKVGKTDYVQNEVSTEALRNLKGFRAAKKLQQAACAYIASNLLCKKDKFELVKLFKSLDSNNDGVLSKDEVMKGFETVAGVIDEYQAENIMKEVDFDRNGFIDYNEFVLAAVGNKKLIDESYFDKVFETFDFDQNGFITADEVKILFSGLEKEDATVLVNEIISQVDENGDGKVSLEEFKNMIRTTLE